MHQRDTDPRRIFSYVDCTLGPSQLGPTGSLGSEFQDSQPPETPMTSQQINELLPRRSPRLHKFSEPSTSTDILDVPGFDPDAIWNYDKAKRPRRSYYDTDTDDLDEDYSEHEPINKSGWR
ncbi:hypothetical protein JCGZ_08607 [Jatropha curcas]|uniref:Uncharacterized protein n=1 Tax=Jatropha curcas TaxID=180498 RepID=A0A067KK19_JATCU|nr:hypothetical protein JCGZ_08607 [Jatropha curcas]